MYDREKIEEALEALSLGFSSSQAAELAGVAPSTVEHWSKGRLPLSWDARGARIAVTGHRGEAARMTETRAPYATHAHALDNTLLVHDNAPVVRALAPNAP